MDFLTRNNVSVIFNTVDNQITTIVVSIGSRVKITVTSDYLDKKGILEVLLNQSKGSVLICHNVEKKKKLFVERSDDTFSIKNVYEDEGIEIGNVTIELSWTDLQYLLIVLLGVVVMKEQKDD